jgi:2,6-dihydroxypseudooxynicotine hydrolase
VNGRVLGREVLGQIAVHWRARLNAVGVPLGVLDGLFARATTWETWGPEWAAQGEAQEAYARELLQRGHHLSAGEAFHAAALFYHFGQLVLFHDIPAKDRLSRRREAAFRAAAPHLAPPARVFTVPAPGGGALRGYLRLPEGRAGKAPCVFVVPGADSVKEENLAFSDVLVRRGLAAVCFDGPGQGETRQDLPFTHDYERGVAPLIRDVAKDPAIDARRLGVVGFSFGGYLAPRVAAFLPEIAACAVLGGCYDLSYWDTMPALLKEDFAYVFDVRTWAEAGAQARRVSLEPVLPNLRCPFLIVHGKRDGIFPWSDAERMAARAAGPAELLIYDEGDHCCHNVAHRSKPAVADWLADRLAGR